MTKAKKRFVNDDNQMSFFDILVQDQTERSSARLARLDIAAKIDAAIKAAIRKAPKSREVLADEMSELTGERISVGMINNWTADSHPHEMPGRFYASFCIATGDIELIRVQAEAAGVFILPGPDVLRAEIHKLEEEAKKLQAEKKKRTLFLQELEKH